MKIYEILGEMTSAGGMASVASPLGGGDPSTSIYTKSKKKKWPKYGPLYQKGYGNWKYENEKE